MVVPRAPVGIGGDRLAASFVKRDVLRRMQRRAGDGHGGKYPVRIECRPLQHLHAPHGTADDAEQVRNVQRVQQHGLRANHVGDRDHRERKAPRPAGLGIGLLGSDGAHAAAENIGADDEILVGIEDFAGADDHFPPARPAGHRMVTGDILIAAQRVTNKNGVRFGSVERPVGLERHREIPELHPAIQAQGLIHAQLNGAMGNLGCLEPCRRMFVRRSHCLVSPNPEFASTVPATRRGRANSAQPGGGEAP